MKELLILVLFVVLIYLFTNNKEHFVDPYPICLHHEALKKQDRWNQLGERFYRHNLLWNF